MAEQVDVGCLFHCTVTNQALTKASKERLQSIIKASKQRHDGLNNYLEEKLSRNPEYPFQYHRSCVSTYTSSEHISRYRKRHGVEDEKEGSQEPPRKRRSSTDQFQFQKHCLFCGNECLPYDPKHPNRRPKVLQCRTIPTAGQTFKESILKVCNERGDKQADDVRTRVLGAPSDLHAADAQYHKNCYSSFMSQRNVQSAKASSSELHGRQPATGDIAMDHIIAAMNESPEHMWTSTELHELYEEKAKASDMVEFASRRLMVSKLKSHYGKELMVMNIEGCASLLCFKQFVPHYLKLVEVQSEEDPQIETIAQKIITEAASLPKQSDYDLQSFNLSEAKRNTSSTLLSLVSKLVSKEKTTKASLSLAQSIQGHITKTPNQTTLGLAIKMHHKFGSREANDILHDHGYAVSYDELIRFRNSSAKYVGEQGFSAMGLDVNGGPIGVWCDNYDLNIFTPNGTRETHAMAIEFTQQAPQANVQLQTSIPTTIPRLSKIEMNNLKLSELSPVQFVHYQGPPNPLPPKITTNVGPTWDNVVKTEASIHSAMSSDLEWLQKVVASDQSGETDIPEWSGYMKNKARDNETHTSATNYVFGPLIDAPPSHPDTVLTTMMHAEQFLKLHGQGFMHLVADMQLYKIILKVKWSDYERWKHLVARPGGMHMLMSFIGSIGNLMKGTGLEELLKSAYKGTPNMLNGKAWPRAVRGLRMVVTALLEDFLSEEITPASLQTKLEEARQTNMGKLWIDCLIIPVWIALLYIRAEREANWPLHLFCVKQMIPYFFASGHLNYAKYAVWYIMDMTTIPDEVQAMFSKGEHVCRHTVGPWNAVFSDQFGEQTYIRYGKAKGGLVGITLSQDQVARWLLSYNVCNLVSQSIDTMFNKEDEKKEPAKQKHKEEGAHRVCLDSEDRQKIRCELRKGMHPLKPSTDKLVNIANGHIADSKVNVHDAAVIGQRMAARFQEQIPEGFYGPVKKEVITMETVKKGVKVGDKTIYDTEKLYARMLVTSAHRGLDLTDILGYELGPIPFSLFDEYGDMRKGNKSVLMNKLAVMSPVSTSHDNQPPSSTTAASRPDIEIVDGNAALYHVQWPKTATVSQLAANFVKYVSREHDVCVVFDRYHSGSIKSHERDRRTAGTMQQDINLTMDTPLPTRNVLMRNENNKRQLIRLICSSEHAYGDRLKMCDEEDPQFCHEEADINLVSYMLLNARDQGKQYIQMKSDDTDVFVLLVYFCWKYAINSQITMKRFDGKDIDINMTARALGENSLQLLPLHVATGCDTVSFPFGKGKLTAVNIMKKGKLNLSAIGEANTSEDELMNVGRHLFCLLYGIDEPLTMSQLRYTLFTTKREKCSNLRLLPPTDEALAYHMKRSHLQAMLWKAANEQQPPDINLEDFGWEIKDGVPFPITMRRPAAPPGLLKVIACGCATNTPCSRKQCSCKNAGMSCTSFCKCQAGEHCQNEHTKRHDETAQEAEYQDDQNDDDHSDD